MTDATDHLASYPLLNALLGRRSRRFGPGMRIPGGPLAHQSREDPLPLTEDEEAVLAFAAGGITGYALGDLAYERAEGGSMMAGLVGRTTASADAINSVFVMVINDQATYLLKRPQDLTPAETGELIDLARKSAFTEVYRRMRVSLKDGRAAVAREPLATLTTNRWSMFAPGSTYFLPVSECTCLLINAMLEFFNEAMAFFVLDERAQLRPAGLNRFARSRGGHLCDDPKDFRVATVIHLESVVAELMAAEQGMILQNLGLAAQALGLGGFTHWASHPWAWLEVLGFRMGQMPFSRFFGAPPFVSRMARLFGRDVSLPYPLGLERDGVPLVTPYCPPYYPSMEAAVRAVVARKYGPQGIYREGIERAAWQDPSAVLPKVPGLSQAAVDATIAFCEYIYNRYGRFPAYLAPFRTVLGFQASHVDLEFYDRFYRPEALTETQREHMARWHAGTTR